MRALSRLSASLGGWRSLKGRVTVIALALVMAVPIVVGLLISQDRDDDRYASMAVREVGPAGGRIATPDGSIVARIAPRAASPSTRVRIGRDARARRATGVPGLASLTSFDITPQAGALSAGTVSVRFDSRRLARLHTSPDLLVMLISDRRGGWQALPTSVDRATQMATARWPHFSEGKLGFIRRPAAWLYDHVITYPLGPKKPADCDKNGAWPGKDTGWSFRNTNNDGGRISIAPLDACAARAGGTSHRVEVTNRYWYSMRLRLPKDATIGLADLFDHTDLMDAVLGTYFKVRSGDAIVPGHSFAHFRLPGRIEGRQLTLPAYADPASLAIKAIMSLVDLATMGEAKAVRASFEAAVTALDVRRAAGKLTNADIQAMTADGSKWRKEQNAKQPPRSPTLRYLDRAFDSYDLMNCASGVLAKTLPDLEQDVTGDVLRDAFASIDDVLRGVGRECRKQLAVAAFADAFKYATPEGQAELYAKLAKALLDPNALLSTLGGGLASGAGLVGKDYFASKLEVTQAPGSEQPAIALPEKDLNGGDPLPDPVKATLRRLSDAARRYPAEPRTARNMLDRLEPPTGLLYANAADAGQPQSTRLGEYPDPIAGPRAAAALEALAANPPLLGACEPIGRLAYVFQGRDDTQYYVSLLRSRLGYDQRDAQLIADAAAAATGYTLCVDRDGTWLAFARGTARGFAAADLAALPDHKAKTEDCGSRLDPWRVNPFVPARAGCVTLKTANLDADTRPDRLLVYDLGDRTVARTFLTARGRVVYDASLEDELYRDNRLDSKLYSVRDLDGRVGDEALIRSAVGAHARYYAPLSIDGSGRPAFVRRMPESRDKFSSSILGSADNDLLELAIDGAASQAASFGCATRGGRRVLVQGLVTSEPAEGARYFHYQNVYVWEGSRVRLIGQRLFTGVPRPDELSTLLSDADSNGCLTGLHDIGREPLASLCSDYSGLYAIRAYSGASCTTVRRVLRTLGERGFNAESGSQQLLDADGRRWRCQWKSEQRAPTTTCRNLNGPESFRAELHFG